MPLNPDSDNPKAIAARMWNEVRPALAKAVAAQMGPAPESVKASFEDMYRLWWQRADEFADPVQAALQVNLLRGKGIPDEQIALEMYPNRSRLLSYGKPSLKAQVSFAKRMQKMAVERGELPLEAEAAARLAEMAEQEYDPNADLTLPPDEALAGPEAGAGVSGAPLGFGAATPPAPEPAPEEAA